MSTTATIIIGFTPFHLIPMRELVVLAEGDIHVFHPMAFELGALETGSRISFLGGCESPQQSRWATYSKARRDIDEIMGSGRRVDLYLPHPFNPLANHAFFHAGSCRRFIYQDGILNYYDATVPLGSFASNVRQCAKGLAIGSWFRSYGGHLSGIDALPVAGGYFTHPNRIAHAGKFPSLQRLDFHHEGKNSDTGGRRDTLFLDQPIELVVGQALARELRNLTVDYVNALGGRVLYKQHYSQGRSISCDKTWTLLDPVLSRLPAERVVPELKVSFVVSFFSSALANVAMSDSAIECHATAANCIPVTVDGRATDLGEVLSGLGVRVVDLLHPGGLTG